MLRKALDFLIMVTVCAVFYTVAAVVACAGLAVVVWVLANVFTGTINFLNGLVA